MSRPMARLHPVDSSPGADRLNDQGGHPPGDPRLNDTHPDLKAVPMNWWHLRPLTLAEMPLCNTRWLGYLIGVAGSVLVLLAWRMLGPDLAASQQWIAQLTTVLGGILLAIGGVLVFETTVGQR